MNNCQLSSAVGDSKDLTINLGGRIDTNNAKEVEDQINEIVQNTDHDSLILDVSNLDYISSVGLRIVMALMRKGENLQVNNANPDIYNIFEMTGINTVIPVNKKRRSISIDGLKKLGEGISGEVFRIDDETIVKVFFPHYRNEYIFRERDVAQKAFLNGIPTAISFDLVDVGDRLGIVFELINARDVNSIIRDEPEKREEIIKKYADFIRDAHSHEVNTDEFTNVMTTRITALGYLQRLGIPKETAQKALDYMDGFPKYTTFLHGDINPGNVMLQDDELLFIDVGTAGYGHPYFDLAVAYLYFALNDSGILKERTGLDLEEGKKLFDIFLKQYFQTEDDEKIEQFKKEILPLVRITQLLSVNVRPNIPPETIELYRNNVIECLEDPPEITY